MTINKLKTLHKNDTSLSFLIEEKMTLQKRLEQLGYDGDCAYEKALVAFYQQRLLDCENIIRQTVTS